MTILILFAFLSGIITILSPCILPVLPIILSGTVGGKRKPVGVILGFVFSFSFFTLLLSSIVRLLNINPDTLRIIAIVSIIIFGLVMAIPWFKELFEMIAMRLTGGKKSKKSYGGFAGGILVGSSLGLVWTPCVGPILASIISLSLSQRVDGGAFLIVIAYSIGTSLPMFAIMLGGRNLIQRFPKIVGNSGRIQQVFGVLMIVVGISLAFGLDRKFQTVVLDIFPDYGSGLTSFENNGLVQKALNDRNSEASNSAMTGINSMSAVDEFVNINLPDNGIAPEIVTAGDWFNTDGKSLKLADLKGKVVLIDFWTYSCINCVRTIPYLKKWYATYKDRGLVIIGVHSPEFAFERNPENVGKAIKELGIAWPVVLDNDFTQWRAYDNRYWPAEYFIDADGKIRYTHFGEGEYKRSEEVIRTLLNDAGMQVSDAMQKTADTRIDTDTPEIYLGYDRSEGFSSAEKIVREKVASYSSNLVIDNGKWSLEGNWKINHEYIEPEDQGVINLGFDAKNVFLVVEPEDGKSRIEIMLDEKPVKNGIIIPKESGLYKLVDLTERGRHSLKIKVEGKMRLFAFTFG